MDYAEAIARVAQSAAQKRLLLFVGNGVSRLAGGPGWSEIFGSGAAGSVLRSEGVEPEIALKAGVPLTALAQVLKRSKNPSGWSGVVRRLQWYQTEKPSATLVDRALSVLNPRQVLTTNVDNLLEREIPDFGGSVVYLHGYPDDDPMDWVFSAEDYRRRLEDVENKIRRAVAPCSCCLFVGYGHSSEDYDICSALSQSDRGQDYFSILTKAEWTGVHRARLQMLGIWPLHLKCPVAPTRRERELSLARVILDIAKRAGHSTAAVETQWQEACGDCWFPGETSREATAVFGHCGRTTFSMSKSPPRFPRLAREALGRRLHREPGGAALTVAQVVASLGQTAALISSLGHDSVGEWVWEEVKSLRMRELPKLLIDFVDRQGSSDRHTWDSYMIIDQDELGRGTGQRVILDDMHEVLDVVGQKMMRNALSLGGKSLYLGRQFRSSAGAFLAEITAACRDGAERPWVFYETGTRGDFPDYNFERATASRNVDVVLSAFPFAVGFLAAEGRKHLTASQKDILGRVTAQLQKEEASAIDLVLEPEITEVFVRALRMGGRRWLADARDGVVRTVVVTLHERGALWVSVDTAEHGFEGVAPSIKVVCSAAAGDVFRGSFIAACNYLRTRDVHRDPGKFLESATSFANRAAGIKVEHIRVLDALGRIEKAFGEWCASI